MSLPSVAAARAAMLARVAPLGAQRVSLARANGRVLARPVVAARDQPPFAASSMDGWAVRAADGAAPRRIVGESAAGRGYGARLGPGEAVRIFTGAPVPEGADAVVVQERARREGGSLLIEDEPQASHIRGAGLDFRAGDRLLEAGVRLDSWRLALAAAAGLGQLQVARRPRLAILSTGEEIVAPGARPGPWQIFDSGTTALASLARSWGARVSATLSAADDEAGIAAQAGGAAVDVFVTLGGASVGDYDLVKPALARLGLELAVDGVNVRPGKPTWFGALGDGRAVLGLPGNPASALVCAELFLRPLLSALQGGDPEPPLIHARLARPLAANGPREHWMRGRLRYGADGGLGVQALGDQDSSLVSVFAAADALVRRPAGAPAASPGESVETLRLDRLS
jgi:molybdopterin molybdotransferase